MTDTAMRTCDRSTCPAPAVHALDVFDQDLYLCNHHAGEVDPGLLVAGRWAVDGLPKAPPAPALPVRPRGTEVPQRP